MSAHTRPRIRVVLGMLFGNVIAAAGSILLGHEPLTQTVKTVAVLMLFEAVVIIFALVLAIQYFDPKNDAEARRRARLH